METKPERVLSEGVTCLHYIFNELSTDPCLKVRKYADFHYAIVSNNFEINSF